MAEEQEALADLGRLETFGHDVEGNALGHAQAFAIQVISPFRVVASGDSTDCGWKDQRAGPNRDRTGLTAGEEEGRARPCRGWSMNVGIEERALSVAVLEEDREELDHLVDGDDLLLKQGWRHALFDDDTAQWKDCATSQRIV